MNMLFRFVEDREAVRNATDALAVGAALGALVAADTPAFQELHVGKNGLDDDGLRPLCEALPRNTQPRTLAVNHNGLSDAFVRQQLFFAVHANTSLRELERGSTVQLGQPGRRAMNMLFRFVEDREAVRNAAERLTAASIGA
jgi:hypothetical protein